MMHSLPLKPIVFK